MAYLLPKSTLALATPPGGLCWVPLTLVILLNLVFPEALSVLLPSSPTPTLNPTHWPGLALTSISVRKWMASGRVTRRFLFRTSFLNFVHL